MISRSAVQPSPRPVLETAADSGVLTRAVAARLAPSARKHEAGEVSLNIQGQIRSATA